MRSIQQQHLPYVSPVLVPMGTVRDITRFNMVSGVETDHSPRDPAGSVGFGI